MKRGQVLLAEHWAREYPTLKVVTCHPGWASTEGVDKAFGESKSLLDPMRSAWEGAEGICWLFVCGLDNIQSGTWFSSPSRLELPSSTLKSRGCTNRTRSPCRWSRAAWAAAGRRVLSGPRAAGQAHERAVLQRGFLHKELAG
jgi:hypothetical protein